MTDKVLVVSSAQVRTMASVAATGQCQPKVYDFKVGRRILRTVWLADLWPTWPYYCDDPDGVVFGPQYHAMDDSPS
jgi:hypothetical protein